MLRAGTTPFGHIGYWLAAVAIASMGWALYSVLGKMDGSSRSVDHTFEVLRSLGDTGEALSRAEAAQRGYLLTAVERFREERDEALGATARHIADLRHLARDNPAQLGRIQRLEGTIKERVALMHENARRRESEDVSSVAAAVGAGHGQRARAEILAVTNELKLEELRLLEQHRALKQRDRENVKRILVWAGAVVLLALIPGYIGFIQQARSRSRAENRLRDLAETLPGAVVEYRTWADGRSRYEYLSPTVETMRGVDRKAALADPQLILGTILEEDRHGFLEALARGARNLTPIEHDYRVRAPDGSVRWLRTTAAPRPSRDGSVLWSAFWADVTEKKALVAALREAKEDAEAANRAKSTFLATMSHEIRTPMNGVLGMLELLSLTKLDREQRTTLEVIRQSGRSLLRIIDDILDFSKVEAGRLELRVETASVADIVHRTCDIYRGSASSKGLQIECFVDHRVSPASLVDPVRLQQILGNLVSNAVKFTAQGAVRVRVDAISAERAEQRLRFTVQDTGIGISPDDQRKLFAPFAQAAGGGRHGGTGLGLVICRRLAEMMGGTLRMESQLGAGTRATLELALPTADASFLPSPDRESASATQGALANRAAPTPDEAALEGTLILVVDDHPINRMVLHKQVNALGYAVESAENGAQALDRWETGRYGLVLSDVNMPGMNGYELAGRIREREVQAARKRTVIIACTANALAGEAEKCFESGMDDYLPKPVQLARLREKLTHWLPLEPAAQASPIDASVLAEISAGDAELQREVVARFHRENASDARELESSVESNRIEDVTRWAHRMKGAARTVGATAFADACERLESAGRRNDWEAVVQTVGAFRAELARLDAHIRSLGGARAD